MTEELLSRLTLHVIDGPQSFRVIESGRLGQMPALTRYFIFAKIYSEDPFAGQSLRFGLAGGHNNAIDLVYDGLSARRRSS